MAVTPRDSRAGRKEIRQVVARIETARREGTLIIINTQRVSDLDPAIQEALGLRNPMRRLAREAEEVHKGLEQELAIQEPNRRIKAKAKRRAQK